MTNSNYFSFCNTKSKVSSILNWLCFFNVLAFHFAFLSSYSLASSLTFLGVMDVIIFFTFAVYCPVSLLCDGIALFYIISTCKKEDLNAAILYIILFSILVFKNLYFVVTLCMRLDESVENEEISETTVHCTRERDSPLLSRLPKAYTVVESTNSVGSDYERSNYQRSSNQRSSYQHSDYQRSNYQGPIYEGTIYQEPNQEDLALSSLEDGTIPVAQSIPTPTPVPTCSGYFLVDC